MKISVISLSAAFLLLVGCGNNTNSISETSPDTTAPTETTAAVTTEEPTILLTVPETQLQTQPSTQPSTQPETQPSTAEPADSDLVLIKDFIPDIVIDLRYATDNNFTGTVIYENDDAFLCYGTVKKLMAVQEQLSEYGYGIIVWDAYRPPEAQEKLWEVCPNPTYVADPRWGITSHSKGNTIDLGIVGLDGSQPELPSGFDEFSLLADRDYSDVSEKAAENSRLLESIMTACGFSGYWGEWWHYSDNVDYLYSY